MKSSTSVAVACAVMVGCLSACGSSLPGVEQHILDAVSQACEGRGIEQAAAYAGEPGLHPAVLVDSLGNRASWTDKVPVEWRATSVGTVELVACVGEEEKVEVEKCEYTGGGSINRYRHERQLRIVNARTGETLWEVVLTGSRPGSCPLTKPSLDPGSDMKGSHVSFEDVRRWLGAYVLWGGPIIFDKDTEDLTFHLDASRFRLDWDTEEMWASSGPMNLTVFRREDSGESVVCTAEDWPYPTLPGGFKVCDGGPGDLRLQVEFLGERVEGRWTIRILPE